MFRALFLTLFLSTTLFISAAEPCSATTESPCPVTKPSEEDQQKSATAGKDNFPEPDQDGNEEG